MEIAWVETLRLPDHPGYLWVRVGTDAGVVGTGETMPRVDAVERIVHDVLAPMLIGTDPAPEAVWERAFRSITYHGYAGAELRALSAIDIALWDLLGRHAGLPVHRLLGGPCRATVPVYNTCVSAGPIRDHERFLSEPGALAEELVEAGYPAMKIWPFDELSVASLGQRIDAADLRQAVRVFAEIRDAVGDAIEVALEGHACWSLPAAVRIGRALEPYGPMWLEDMLHAGDPRTWRQLKEQTSIPLCGSERLFTRYQIQPFLEAGAVDVVKQDIAWAGGFTEVRKVASLADQFARGLAPHNCLGPIGTAATLHLAAAVPNLYLMETVRAFTQGFHRDLVDEPLTIERGHLRVPERPGLGLELRDDVLAAAVAVRTDQGGSRGWHGGDPWAGDLGDRI